MISKEKLLNGYVKTDNKELLKLFLIECLKYDDINLPLITESTYNKWWYFTISKSMTPCGHGISAVDDKKELTINDFKPKPKNRFSIGDKVMLDGLGDVYTTYGYMANCMGLSGYSYGRFPETNQELKVVGEDIHPDTGVRLLGVRDSDGYEYVVGDGGLVMVEKNKPKTKVTYELVTDMTNSEVAKAMIDGEVFYSRDGKVPFRWDGSAFVNDMGLPFQFGLFYRKVEKENDWKDEALNYVGGCKHLELNSRLDIIFADSIDEGDVEFDREFLELCRVTLRSTGEL